MNKCGLFSNKHDGIATTETAMAVYVVSKASLTSPHKVTSIARKKHPCCDVTTSCPLCDKNICT